MTTITEAEAHAAGFVVLTNPYAANEKWMLVEAISQLSRAGTPYRLVDTKDGIEIWRTRKGYSHDPH